MSPGLNETDGLTTRPQKAAAFDMDGDLSTFLGVDSNHSVQPSFFLKTGSVSPGFCWLPEKKDPRKEWKWKVPL